jgi:AbiJ N-terminal domain 4
MAERTPFSERHGFKPAEREISVRHEFPVDLRSIVVDFAYESGLRPAHARPIVCKVLRKREDPSNWSEYPNVDGEVRQRLDDAEWYEVYDVIEAFHRWLAREGDSEKFERELNNFFRKEGIGWQLANGQVEIRGAEALQQVVEKGEHDLAEKKLKTAAGELKQALADLSRRPEADVTGAVQHALAAVECSAREVTGHTKATLGEVIKRNPGFFPPPLDSAVEKMWGYASERGRHLREGEEPTEEQAHLVVGLSAALASFIASKK